MERKSRSLINNNSKEEEQENDFYNLPEELQLQIFSNLPYNAKNISSVSKNLINLKLNG